MLIGILLANGWLPKSERYGLLIARMTVAQGDWRPSLELNQNVKRLQRLFLDVPSPGRT